MPVWPWWPRSCPPATYSARLRRSTARCWSTRLPKRAQLPQWLVKEARERLGMDLGLQEARLLVQRCGDNQNILLRELEKLQIYADERG